MVRLLYCFQKWHKVKFFPHTTALPSSNVLQECQQMPTAQHTHRASPILNPFIHQLSLRNKIVWDDFAQSSNENSPYSGLKSCQHTHIVTHTHTHHMQHKCQWECERLSPWEKGAFCGSGRWIALSDVWKKKVDKLNAAKISYYGGCKGLTSEAELSQRETPSWWRKEFVTQAPKLLNLL